jgi:hypothetical protein
MVLSKVLTESVVIAHFSHTTWNHTRLNVPSFAEGSKRQRVRRYRDPPIESRQGVFRPAFSLPGPIRCP